jgi:hypothetical protein
MNNNEQQPTNGVEAALLSNEGFDITAKAFALENRLALLAEYSQKEFAAFAYFKRIARATQRDGATAEKEYVPDSRDGQGTLVINYPPIDYNPDPADSSQRRLVLLKEVRVAAESKTITVTPWLQVHTMDSIEQYGFDTDNAEIAFTRCDLEALCGWNDFGDADALGEALLLDQAGDGKALKSRITEQTDYVTWLGRCAGALDMPRQFGASLPLPANILDAQFDN